jgi:hypothetical protein
MGILKHINYFPWKIYSNLKSTKQVESFSVNMHFWDFNKFDMGVVHGDWIKYHTSYKYLLELGNR